MPVLTACAPDPRRPGFRVLVVDRGRFASLPGAAVDGLSLTVGRAIAPPTLARLETLADEEAAFRAAQRALARRGHAKAELRRRLLRRQHTPDAVDAALVRLTQSGLLDDWNHALQYCRSRLARGRGPTRWIADLTRQGVPRPVAEAATQQILREEEVDVQRMARTVAQGRIRQLAAIPPSVARRRLNAYLVRRGFNAAEVAAAIRGLITE